MSRRGGIVVRVGDRARGRLFLVPEEVARGVVVLPSVTPVEGLRLPAAGLSLANGEVVTVLCLDPRGLSPSCRNERTIAVLCDGPGGHVALAGVVVEAAGLFDVDGPGKVRWGEEHADLVDVNELCAEAETALWAERTAALRLPEVSP
jgi:hypothetical protein